MKNSLQNSISLLSYRVTSILFIVTLILIYGGSVDGCYQLPKPCGETSPGRIFLHVGQPLELFCSIDIEKVKAGDASVEDLIFRNSDGIIEPSYVTRVNETTIRLYMENQQESQNMYYCYLQKNLSATNDITIREPLKSDSSDIDIISKLVCADWVSVGQSPQEVEHVSCVSLNWQMLNCSWEVPKNNVSTSYEIHYAPKHRHSELLSCPTDSDLKENFCLWTLRSRPMYRRNFEVLQFVITGKNEFGSNKQIFFFNMFAQVVLDGPKDVQLQAKESTSLTLQWDIDVLRYFPKPLIYKIQYISSNDSEWHTLLATSEDVIREDQHVWYNISDLTPKTEYDFRVFMKSSIAPDKFWSKNYASKRFSTA